MNKFIISSLLLLSISLPVLAGSDARDGDSVLNPIRVFNKTNTDIAYIMRGNGPANGKYGIKAGKVDIYHTKISDKNVSFEVGRCRNMKHDVAMCGKPVDMKNCVSNQHYNGEQISSVTIDSLTSCTVTCIDGGSTTCKRPA